MTLLHPTHAVFILRGAEPPSTHPLCDTPSRYDVTPTLSYAVEFIVCTAADYRCLACRTGDLKRQRHSQHCIRLACRKARGMLGSLGSTHVFLCGKGHETCGSQQEARIETRLNILVSNIDTLWGGVLEYAIFLPIHHSVVGKAFEIVCVHDHRFHYPAGLIPNLL